MSYILDALRKADAQRERDASRGIHAQSAPLGTRNTAEEGRPAWTWAAVAAAAAVLVAGGWYALRDRAPEPPAPVAVATAPAPVSAPPVVTAPAQPPAPSAAVLPPPAAPIVGTQPAGRTVPQRDIANPALQNPRAAAAASGVIPELPASVRAAQAREQAMARAAGGRSAPTSALMPHGSLPAGVTQVAQVGGMPQQGPASAGAPSGAPAPVGTPSQPGVAAQPSQSGAVQPGAATQPAATQPNAVQPGVQATQPGTTPTAIPSQPAVAPQPPRQTTAPTARSAAPPMPPVTPSSAPAPQAVGLPADAPKLSIGGGVYSANASQRMLIVNGQVFNEGSEVAPGVVLQAIQPKTAVVRFRGGTYTVTY